MAPLVVVGGTFDPPHAGHLLLGECARVQFGARRVLYLPAGDPYRKTGSAGPEPGVFGPPRRQVSPVAHRLEMTRLAIRGNRHFALDDREARRDGPTYTVDTLESLHAEGCDDIVLVFGSDAIADMPNWKQPARIVELARLAVVAKAPGVAVPAAPGGATVTPIEMPYLPISSTLVRERVARGLPVRYLVPDAVERYIRRHGLYRDA